MKTAIALAALLGSTVTACRATGGFARANDPAGVYSFDLVGLADSEGDATRIAWRVRDPTVTVVAQRIPQSDHAERERSLQGVADAIVERYAAGEVAGSMMSEECLVAGRPSQCLDGWIEGSGQARVVRRGVIVPLGSEFLVLEVMGREETVAARQLLVLRESLALAEPSP